MLLLLLAVHCNAGLKVELRVPFSSFHPRIALHERERWHSQDSKACVKVAVFTPLPFVFRRMKELAYQIAH